ncbi:hypothetical protein NT01EI_2072 [Edwardsiella ictaluri 93-146]|uniref:Uncharacterized protein n=1 Tax=Edwardsiella ictaluri (strain 93-146) TaxID=634503 RepID=C5BDD1_EDWI9|nr:hypothetical protein NT01EI_2072 [Edwardsiella ictaluri 93-146]
MPRLTVSNHHCYSQLFFALQNKYYRVWWVFYKKASTI